MEFEVAETEQVSMAVVRAVSEVEGSDPTSIPPLANQIDPNALDSLFESGTIVNARNGSRFSFDYANHRVTIENGTSIAVRPLE